MLAAGRAILLLTDLQTCKFESDWLLRELADGRILIVNHKERSERHLSNFQRFCLALSTSLQETDW